MDRKVKYIQTPLFSNKEFENSIRSAMKEDLIPKPAEDLINEFANEKTKKLFHLDSILCSISIKILNYRINEGLTQKEFSEKLGIKQTKLSKLESGEYNYTIKILWEISQKTGLNFEINTNPA